MRIKVTVGIDGRATATEIAKSSGASREHKLLDRAAEAAIQRDLQIQTRYGGRQARAADHFRRVRLEASVVELNPRVARVPGTQFARSFVLEEPCR